MATYTYEIPDSLPEEIKKILKEDIDETIKTRVATMLKLGELC